MKKFVSLSLAMSTLISLSACGGQIQSIPGAGYNPNSQFAANPYAQNSYNYQTPMQQMNQQGQLAQTGQRSAQQAQFAQQQGYAQQQQVSLNQAQSIPQSVPQSVRQSIPQSVPQSVRQSVSRQSAATPNAAPPQAAGPASAPGAPQAAPQPAKRSANDIAQDILQKTGQKFQQLQNFRAEAVIEEKNEEGQTNLTLDAYFQKPQRNKIHIKKHSKTAMAVGAQATYISGSNEVRGKAGGVMSFMKLTVPMDDERITSRRGYRLDQMDTNAIMKRLVLSGRQPKILGKTNMGGSSVLVLEYPAQNHFDPRITRELLGIDMNTHLIRIHEMYEGPQRVYSIKLNNFQVDAPLSEKDFTI